MPTRTRKPAARKILTFRLIVHTDDGFYGRKESYAFLKRGNHQLEYLCDDYCKMLRVTEGEYTVTLKPVAPAKAKKTAKKAQRRAR
jgi:hypothetical protein